jgi:hypothetical protein
VAQAEHVLPEEQHFAEAILYRTSVDPVALGVGVGCFVLFWLIIYFTLF